MNEIASGSMTLMQLTELVMEQAKEKGFGISPEEINFSEKIALIHSEVSEVLTAYRHKNMDDKGGVAEELGDVIQRVLHLCGVLSIDVEAAILKKIEANKTRSWGWDALGEKRQNNN